MWAKSTARIAWPVRTAAVRGRWPRPDRGVAPSVGRSLVLLADHVTQRGQRSLCLFDEVLQADDRRVGVVVRNDLVLLLGYVRIVHADDPEAVLVQHLES